MLPNVVCALERRCKAHPVSIPHLPVAPQTDSFKLSYVSENSIDPPDVTLVYIQGLYNHHCIVAFEFVIHLCT